MTYLKGERAHAVSLALPRRGRKRVLLPVILRAATRLFVRRGFDRPTMEEVATAAGVRKAALYSYFDTKSALIDAVVDELLRERPVMPQMDESLPLRQQLIDVGLQLHRLVDRRTTVALSTWLSGQRLPAKQLVAWTNGVRGLKPSS